MSRSIFHPDSALMITLSQITDCIFLSLFWLLGCFPVVTFGASAAALYDAVWRGFRQGDKHPWQRFVHSFRQNFVPSLVPTALVLAVLAGMLRLGVYTWNQAVYGNLSWAVFSGEVFLMLVAAGMGSLIFPILSRFENSTAQLLGNAFRLGFAHLPGTLLLGFLNGATLFVCLRWIFPLFFLPALTALISTWIIEPMLKPYLPEPEEGE